MKPGAKFYRIILTILLAVVLFGWLAGCNGRAAPTPEPTITPTIALTEAAATQVQEEADQERIIITPTLAPTSTPGPLDEMVSEVAAATGIDRQVILGLTGEDWINLGISAILIIVSILLLGRLIYQLIYRIAKASKLPYAPEFVKDIRKQIQWFIWISVTQFSINRLLFLEAEFKHWLNKIFFTIYVLLISIALWKLLDFAIDVYTTRFESEQDTDRGLFLIPLIRRGARVLLLVFSSTIILENFGVNVTALMAAIGVVGFALGLAAQDTLTDTISGFIILFDRPFRVGDRIEVSELNTWGDVVEIGTRTTRIRTLDNRMVIVPNSTIGSNQVVNYTYPDSRYRVQVELGIAYETDLEEVRQVISSAVLSVDAVLKDKPVDVLFLEFGETALQFRVRWWIESYVDTRRVFDKVNSAIYVALEEAGIEVPHTVDVRFEKGDVDKKSQPLPGAEDDPAL